MQNDQEKHLLIVEDDEALRERLSRAMERRGFVVISAAGFESALRCLSEKTPDFAIFDLHLPDGSGLDLVHEISTNNPDARAVVFSGYGNIPAAVHATRYGAVDFIVKPATADEISDVLLTPVGQKTPPPVNPTLPESARMDHIERVLRDEGNNISKAARSLNMHRRTLQRVLLRKNGSEFAHH